MRAMFIYNPNSGLQKINNRLSYIVETLLTKYSVVDVFKSQNKEDFIKKCQESCGVYDTLIFAGGDGTFNMVVNALANKENKPILGVLPTGTINDAAKNFGIKRNLKKALKIILKQNAKYFDVGKINDHYFAYVAAIGAYADIPLVTSPKVKKKIGPLAYYFKALPRLFKIRKIEGEILIDNKKLLPYKTPFILVLNSSHMGGFKINPKSNMSDGKFDLYLSKPEPFNGIFSYLLFKNRLQHYLVSSMEIQVPIDDNWDIDGETGPKGNVKISVICNEFRIYQK